jgi:hypothetical protein
MNRRVKSRFRLPSSGVESLESRQLLTGGSIPALADQLVTVSTVEVRDLGSVTPSAAVAGVQATANVPATSSVAFQFSIQLGGEYRLLVRHTGDDLSLVAATPAGTATLDAGQPGPFHQILLDLVPGTYQVTATAAGSEPVFVDWELVLYNGVSQSASLVVALGSASTTAANCGPIPGNLATSPDTSQQAAAPSATSSQGGLYLTLQTAPMGNPLSPGQPAGLADDNSSPALYAAPDPMPTHLAANQTATPDAWPAPSRLDASSIARSNITPKPSATADLDRQSLQAVAWVNGLINRMSLDSVIGLTTGDVPLATVAAAEQASKPAAPGTLSEYTAQPKTIDQPDLTPVLAVGMAVVAVKYGRSIPKRSRTLTSIFRIGAPKTPARIDADPHGHEPWYVRLSQWRTPVSICAQFGRSANSAANEPWNEESLF